MAITDAFMQAAKDDLDFDRINLNHKVKVMTVAGPPGAGWTICRLAMHLVTLRPHQGGLRALRRPQRTRGNQSEIGVPPLLDESGRHDCWGIWLGMACGQRTG